MVYYSEYKKHRHSTPVSINTTGQPTIGDVGAAVHIVVFQDLYCPGCKHFAATIYPSLTSRYVDAGYAKYTLIPLPFLPNSKEAAQVALTIYRIQPTKFFPYIDLFYEAKEKKSFSTKKQLLALANKVQGIDIAALKRGITSWDSSNLLEKNLDIAAAAMKSVATPAIFVNGVNVSNLSKKELCNYIDQQIWENGRAN